MNLQCLCIECHEAKSRKERAAKERVEFGEDGWPKAEHHLLWRY